ncbi:hypothetical protein QUF84_16475 [Fictibacillus enclensis]|uniref:hypothetical protein n=1 Tax=Fictibacillus enclensis TaxID=1017270 RepID=UPI0025A1E829|nr:hypothetical protein [Fictibacillus enclensis]MDM5338810.1 hypothetical protein [Fictibacillus enclensis]
MLKIRSFAGYELQKEKSNSPEDLFNRSEVKYTHQGKDRSFELLYVRFLEEQLPDLTEQLTMENGEQLAVKDIAALACLMQADGYLERRKVYINNQDQFSILFQNLDWNKVKKIWVQMEQHTSNPKERLL